MANSKRQLFLKRRLRVRNKLRKVNAGRVRLSVYRSNKNISAQLIDDVNGFYLLAKGMQENGGADVVYKEFKGGGKILNFSSVGLWHSISDPHIADLINSFIHKN